MSFWIYRKDKTGKSSLWAIDVEPLVVMIPLGLLMAILVPKLIRDPIPVAKEGAIVLAAGFLCFLTAKVSLFRRRIWTSWGPRAMTLWWGRLYKISYLLMIVGTILVLFAYAATP